MYLGVYLGEGSGWMRGEGSKERGVLGMMMGGKQEREGEQRKGTVGRGCGRYSSKRGEIARSGRLGESGIGKDRKGRRGERGEGQYRTDRPKADRRYTHYLFPKAIRLCRRVTQT